ncbi:Interleukin-27 receptor subunit alpha [Myotis davidii]|uniref:Interleukin-27 receptor subunit alpha n=1 Tax=Myotis davidii TaxID=225400 RepID=L5M061_MYODS|nr:Interleukin-27 receptor subunit alpha [Myotis davidii]
MRGAWGAPCRLLPLLLLLSPRTSVQGSPGPLRCYGVGPLGDLNCSWQPLGDLGAPSTLHLQSQKYMAKHPLPLLLAVWVLVGGLWLEAEGKKQSDKGNLCGLELARAIIRTCDKPQRKRSDNLAQEAMGEARGSGREERGIRDMGWA